MNVISKWKVNSVQISEGSRPKGKTPDGQWLKDEKTGGMIMEPCNSGIIKMSPVYANNDANHENSKFWSASPSGSFEMSVNNWAALEHLKVGKEYYLTLTEAPVVA